MLYSEKILREEYSVVMCVCVYVFAERFGEIVHGYVCVYVRMYGWSAVVGNLRRRLCCMRKDVGSAL
jgi:hypothetical protein